MKISLTFIFKALVDDNQIKKLRSGTSATVEKTRARLFESTGKPVTISELPAENNGIYACFVLFCLSAAEFI